MHLFRRVHIHIFADLRTRPHQAHVADKYVDQLRQLVKLVFADEVAGPRNPGIMAADGDQPLFVRADAHRTELEQPEVSVIPPDARLPIEHRPSGIRLDPDGKDGKQRKEDKQPEAAGHDVKKTFQNGLDISTRESP